MTTPPCIYPTLRYKDANRMLVWLQEAFGFREHVVYRDGDTVAHAELALGSSILMLGQSKDDAYGKMVGDPDTRRTDSIYIAVTDPDALHARAAAAGATIEMAPHDTDHGSRDFICRDPEGNLWSFGTYWPTIATPGQ